MKTVKKKLNAVKKKTPGGRRTEIQTPNSNAEVKAEIREATEVVRSSVSAGEIKPCVEDTVWRVVNEISPELESEDNAQMNSNEVAYIIVLHMVLGSPGDNPRRGLKIRNHEYPVGEVPLCREHR